MDYRKIKTFLTVASLLNFNRSASVLNYSQSAVSAQIKSLEDHFGVPLFNRIGKKVNLTEAGEVFVRYAKKLLSLQEEAASKVCSSQYSKGMISLRSPQTLSTYYLPSVIEIFNTEFPNVSIDISMCALHTLQNELESGVVDVAFLLSDSLDSSNFNAEVLSFVELSVIAHVNNPISKQKYICFSDLEDQIILLPKHDCSYKMIIESELKEKKVNIGKTIEYNCIEGIKQCLYRGIGVAFLPDIAFQTFNNVELIKLKWSDVPIELAIIMIWHKDKWLSDSTKYFMDQSRKIFPLLNGSDFKYVH